MNSISWENAVFLTSVVQSWSKQRVLLYLAENKFYGYGWQVVQMTHLDRGQSIDKIDAFHTADANSLNCLSTTVSLRKLGRNLVRILH